MVQTVKDLDGQGGNLDFVLSERGYGKVLRTM